MAGAARGVHAGQVEFPVSLALAQAVQSPPTGPDWFAEPKMDGHRLCLWRLADTVRLQSRAGRDVTPGWFDLAVAGMKLPPGTVIDGEACVWVDGRVSFSAAQSRGASTPARARALAAAHPATLAAFDLLQHPVHGDVRTLTYLERRALLIELLEPIGPPSRSSPPPGTGRSPPTGTRSSRSRASKAWCGSADRRSMPAAAGSGESRDTRTLQTESSWGSPARRPGRTPWLCAWTTGGSHCPSACRGC